MERAMLMDTRVYSRPSRGALCFLCQPPDQGVDSLRNEQADHNVDPPWEISAEEKHVDERRGSGGKETHAPERDLFCQLPGQGPQRAKNREIEDRRRREVDDETRHRVHAIVLTCRTHELPYPPEDHRVEPMHYGALLR